MKSTRSPFARAHRRAAFCVLTICTLHSVAANAQTLPPGWAASDVGAPTIPGIATHLNQTYTVSGAGTGIDGTADQFTFAYRRITGDATVIARVPALPLLMPNAQAGVMIRQGLGAGSQHGAVLVSRAEGITFRRRSSAGGATAMTAVGSGTAAVWVRVDRRASTITASWSADGTTWTAIGTGTVSMNNALYVGLAATSRTIVAPVVVSFTGVQASSLVEYGGPLPAGWSSQDIGGPGLPGAAAYDQGTFGLEGGGSDIGGSWDQFRFAYASSDEDVDIVARVRDLGNTNAQSKAGVMIRDSLTANGAHAAMFVTSSGATTFRRRAAGGGATVDTPGPSRQAPVWLKLSLRDGVVTASQSADGAAWTVVGTQPLTLPVPFHVGLAVTSRDDAATVTANIDNVAVTVVPAQNDEPTVALTEPLDGASYAAGDTVTVSADASDSDGTVAKVDFYRDATLIASDTTSPFSVAWTSAAAGTYSLTAVATDDDGATTTSAARAITVTAANQPPTVALTAPADGATFTAPATITLSADATDSDGTVARVDFFRGTTLIGSDTTSPYSVTWSNAAAGSYSLTAVATDDEGATVASAARTITVNAAANQPPTVALTAPANGATFTAPASITVSANASDTDGTIARVDFYQGSTLIGTDATSPYSITWSNVPAGSYSLTARAFDDDGGTTTSAARSVTVNPPANQPPTVALTAPANGATFTAPANITVSANASDTDGTIARVDFYQGTTLIASDTTSPYSITWSNAPAGTYSLTARAFDDDSATTTSAARSVTVNPPANQPPTVALTAPANGATFTAPASITVSANASDTDGTIARVDFYQGTTLIGSDTASPYSISWNNVPAGSYSLTARAFDDDGATTTSAARSITVNPPANQPPSSSLTAPASGATFTAPANIIVSASASDTDGTIARVDFYQGTTLIGSDTASPYSISWNNVPAGSYSLTARATDDDGATTTSAARTITVNPPPNQAPTTALTSPAGGSTYAAPANITVSANASDSDGTVARVDFYQGTTLIGSDTTSPYSITWSNVAAGSYSLTARATDNAGATTTSGAVSITVTSGELPAGWTAADVGNPTPAGSTNYSSGTFAMTAGGADIWNASDQFHFAYQAMSGDLDIVARVATMGNTSPYAKSGIMIRTSLAANSAHASMLLTPQNGTEFVRRPTTGAMSVNAPGVATGAPVWVKLTRRGSTISGYDSLNGTTWTLRGTETLTLGTTFYVGLALTSHNTTTAITSNIDGVSAVPVASNQPPAAALTAPANGATFTAPANVTISATASDSDGTIARVEFYQGATLIASDTTSPYSITWSNVAAGTYSLTARAVDDAGATTTSAAVSITVNPGSNQPPTASLTAPANGATFTAPATITISATAGDTDGTVARVDFYQGSTLIGSDTSSPYSITWSNVPAGTYSLTARATDDDGATTTSAARSITVSGTTTQRNAVFSPSPDHDSLVNSYLLEIFAAGANPATATPIATQNLGKPAVVNGEVTAEVTSTINALSPGNYQATVSAVGSGGSSRSGAATFTR